MEFDELIGKTMLVGLTYLNAQEEEAGEMQIHGTVVRVDEDGIIIQQEDGEEFAIPADMSAIEPAEPGDYKLNTTGEVVVDPDFIALWTIMGEE